jgi:putative hydrolase of HD superfamily
LHDIGESLIGDITPFSGITASEKSAREDAAVAKLCGILGDADTLALWREFEAGVTAEARLVKDLDVIEMANQALDYERNGKLSVNAAENFVESARKRIRSEVGARALEWLIKLREPTKRLKAEG